MTMGIRAQSRGRGPAFAWVLREPAEEVRVLASFTNRSGPFGRPVRRGSRGHNSFMPERSYPGVYVEEVSSRVHPIEGVATSAAAFVVTTDRLEWVEDAPALGRRRHLYRAVTLEDFADLAMAAPGAGVGRATASPIFQSARLFFENGGSALHLVPVPAGGSLSDALSVLDEVPGLGLLCLPDETDVERLGEALAYAERRRLFLIADPPGDDEASAIDLAGVLAKT